MKYLLDTTETHVWRRTGGERGNNVKNTLNKTVMGVGIC
jgi:hypothetical protein